MLLRVFCGARKDKQQVLLAVERDIAQALLVSIPYETLNFKRISSSSVPVL